MSKLINTIEEFVSLVPTAQGSEWAALETFVDMAESALIDSLWGADLHTSLVALEEADEYKFTAQKLLAFTAYHTAIPFVDLVATPNGFAVVSNANHAPASKERVERLLQWCVLCIDGLTDLIIRKVMENETLRTEWAKYREFPLFTDCFFITGIDFCYAAGIKDTLRRSAFLQHKPDMKIWQRTVLAPVISEAYLDQLINMVRTNAIGTAHANIIEHCRNVLVAMVNKNKMQEEMLLQRLGNLLDWNIENYATYQASKEYALKNTAFPSNEADHPTFHFGL